MHTYLYKYLPNNPEEKNSLNPYQDFYGLLFFYVVSLMS